MTKEQEELKKLLAKVKQEDWTAPDGKVFKGAVKFHLDDDPLEYVLFKDFNKICEAEEETGVNLMRALAGGQITATQTRAVLYALLKTAHAVLLNEAGDLLSRPDWVTGLIAMRIALGVPDEEVDIQEPAPSTETPAAEAPAKVEEPVAA